MANYEMRASRLTVGTLGEAGNRTFFLQAIRGLDSFAVVIEKQQAIALADAIEELLNKLEDRYELPPLRPNRIPPSDLELQLPVEERFRVSQMGLGYDESTKLVLIALEELILEEDPLAPPRIARFWATRDQMAALSRHARQLVVSGGRPICPLCGEAINQDGHFCPRSNGYAH